MSLSLRVALAIVISFGFGELSVWLISPPWGYVCASIGGIAIGFLMARAK